MAMIQFCRGLMPNISKMVTPVLRAARYGEKDVWAIFTPLANEYKAGKAFPLPKKSAKL